MAGGDLHEITSILNKKGWAKKTKLSRTERELGAAFCARAGQSRPQQANRSFTCLSKPGTLPFGAWRNVIPVPERPGDERNPPVLATDVQWCAGDVVVISRGGGGVVFVLDEEVCFSDNLVRGLPCRELLQRGHFAIDLKKKGSSLSKTEIRIHISNVRILEDDNETIDLSEFYDAVIHPDEAGIPDEALELVEVPEVPEEEAYSSGDLDCDPGTCSDAGEEEWQIACCKLRGCKHSRGVVQCDGCEKWFHTSCAEHFRPELV